MPRQRASDDTTTGADTKSTPPTLTLGDFPDTRGIPDVDPRDCIPSLAGYPHGHDILCVAWREARDDARRRVQDEMTRYPAPRRAF